MSTVNTIVGPLYVDDQGDADQPVALLWPSLFTDHRMWRHQVVALHEEGWRTLAVDPPGHGRSPGPGRDFTMDECADAVVEVLEAKKVHSPIAFMGTSWGGFIAPRVALRAPDRVRALVVFNTSAERGSNVERLRAMLLTKLMAFSTLDQMTTRMIVAGLVAPETRRTNPGIGADLVDHLLAWNRRDLIAAVRSVLVDRDALLDRLPQVQTPVLVVSGGEDHTLPSIHSQRIVARLPNSRHVEVVSAAHLVPLEAPDEANALIVDFLR